MKIRVRVLLFNLGIAALALAVSLSIALWVNRSAGEVASGFVFLTACLWGSLFLMESEKMAAGTGWRAAIVLATMYYVFPSALVLLATSGNSHSLAAVPAGSGVFTRHHLLAILKYGPAFACLGIIGFLTVMTPMHLRFDDRPWREGSPVPGWLAGCAAAVSGLFVLFLRLSGVIPTGRLGPIAFVGFGLGTLLAPFYRVLINACWRDGPQRVYDPVPWVVSGYKAWQQIWGDYYEGLSDEEQQRAYAEAMARQGIVVKPPEPQAETT